MIGGYYPGQAYPGQGGWFGKLVRFLRALFADRGPSVTITDRGPSATFTELE